MNKVLTLLLQVGCNILPFGAVADKGYGIQIRAFHDGQYTLFSLLKLGSILWTVSHLYSGKLMLALYGDVFLSSRGRIYWGPPIQNSPSMVFLGVVSE